MKCHRCGQDTEVLETRKADDGYTLRRMRSCPSGHRFPTYEAAAPVYRKHSIYVAKVIGAIKVRVDRWQRDLRVAEMAARMSQQTVANRLGIPKATVGKIVRRMRKWLPSKTS